MEKKSIGAFIAVLRKVNGMTQRELADRLGVSDKTVSHWERDDSAPDLTLIPVIAEIFGVTCDELLRGERIKDASEEAYRKTEKQVKHLLSKSRGKFKTRSMISLGLSIAGLLSAMILNFGANRAYIGFLVGCIFWAAAIICESVFYSHASSAVSGDDFDRADAPSIFGDSALNDYRIYAVRLTAKIICVSVIMLCASLPLFIIPYDTFQGITLDTWLLRGSLAAVIAAAICLCVVHAVNNALISKGVYKLEKSADIKRHRDNGLKTRCIAVIAAILLALLAGQALFNGAFGADAFAAGTTFDNFEGFKKYMETEKESDIYKGDTALQQAAADNEEYFDMNGNSVSKEQALTEYIYGGDGNVLYQYVHLNQEVTFTKYSGFGADITSFTAYTSEQLQSGQATKDFINARLLILYFIVIGAGFLVYFKKRERLN